MRRVLAAMLVCAAPATWGSAGASPPTGADAAHRGATYLVSRQETSGAFFGPDLVADGVAEAVASLIAGGVSGAPINKALGYLAAHGPERAQARAAYAGRIVMGLAAAGQNPRSFGGFDYVAELQSHYTPGGAYETKVYADALAVLGVLAAGDRPPPQALEYLRLNECPGGGFGHDAGCTSTADVDTTSLVVNVLAAAGIGASDPVRARARAFLIGAQNDDGGFGLYRGSTTNGNSTGLALSAIASMGESPGGWTAHGTDPLSALLHLQLSSGGFRYVASQSRPNDYATVQAIPGAAGLAYPVILEKHGTQTPSKSKRATPEKATGARVTATLPSAGRESTPRVEGRSMERSPTTQALRETTSSNHASHNSREIPLAAASTFLVLAALAHAVARRRVLT
jgi:hypothetical protein